MSAFLIFFALLSLIVLSSAFVPRIPVQRRSVLSLDMKLSGKVKFFDSTKGFGFITPDAGGEDIFVHQTAIYAQGFRSLAEGEAVEYEVGEDPRKGKKFATNVTGPAGGFVQGAPRREPRGYDNERY